jgi:hypothetical protein
MGFVSGLDDFAFPPGQAYRCGSLDFITDSFGKISLLDSDSNQSGGDNILAPFGLPNSAEIYSKILSSELDSNHSDGISTMPFHMVTSSSSLDQDGAVYQPIMMRLPDDLATVFGSRSPTSGRSRSDSSSNSVRSSFREVGVILQRLGSCSTEEIDEYLSSSSNDSYALTKIIDYGDFDDEHDFDNFDNNYYDDYTPRFFGVFMANNETDEQRREHEAAEERAR